MVSPLYTLNIITEIKLSYYPDREDLYTLNIITETK